MSLSGGQGRPGTESRGTRFRGFGPGGGAASLCSRCSRRFQVLAPLRGFMCVSPQFANSVRATGPQVSARAAYLALAVQAWSGEGRQGPRLLRRVLSLAPECLYFLFLFEKFLLFKPPWSTQAPACSQLSLALSQDSCSSPCAWAGVSAALVPRGPRTRVPGTLLSLSTLLTVRSFNVLYLWSLIFIYAGILLAVRSAPQIS